MLHTTSHQFNVYPTYQPDSTSGNQWQDPHSYNSPTVYNPSATQRVDLALQFGRGLHNGYPIASSSSSPYSHDYSELRVQINPPHGTAQHQESMQSAHTVAPSSWQANSKPQLTPISTPRCDHHQRASSTSSFGSAGPASPHNYSSSPYLQIAQTPESAFGDFYYEGLTDTEQAAYLNPCVKAVPNSNRTPLRNPYLTTTYPDYSVDTSTTDAHSPCAMVMQKIVQQGVDEETMPAPELTHSSRPSVTTKTDSPATPPGSDSYDDRRRRQGEFPRLVKLIRAKRLIVRRMQESPTKV